MAGGWIKVEKSTIRKSEVTAIARLLGVTRHHALGLLLHELLKVLHAGSHGQRP